MRLTSYDPSRYFVSTKRGSRSSNARSGSGRTPRQIARLNATSGTSRTASVGASSVSVVTSRVSLAQANASQT
jgi:hypothetical protein